MQDKVSFGKFLKKYGTNEKCLEVLKNLRYPNGVFCRACNKVKEFYKIEGRQVYQCSCGNQIAPLAGTILEKTTTPLQYWFYAIFIMSATRSGVSAKQLQRELGVTYKTAWRMFKQIRMLMANVDGSLLSGIVEIDETFIGGKGKNRKYLWHGNERPKEVIMGMVQRSETKKGGEKVYLKHIPNTGKWTLLKQIQENIDPKARIITDQWGGYMQLPKFGYKHDYVDHGKTYVVGDIYSQNAENVWSILKRGIYGVYRIVSKKYLQAYIDEYAWRYNHRKSGLSMFDLLLQQLAEVKYVKS